MADEKTEALKGTIASGPSARLLDDDEVESLEAQGQVKPNKARRPAKKRKTRQIEGAAS